MSKNIEVWSDYDRAGEWCLHIQKKRGKLSLDEIVEACINYEQDFYLLTIKAMDFEVGQYYDTTDLDGDFVTLYRADDFFKWRERET